MPVCASHGTPLQHDTIQILGKTFQIGLGCPRCEKEAAEKERLREQLRQWEQFTRLQDNSGIPPRYRSAVLEPFPFVASGQDKVLDDALAFIETVGKGSTGLILLGQVGAGKTHVACAIINAFLRRGLSGKYLSTAQAFRLIRESWRRENGTSERQTLKQLCALDLLVLDEVGVERGTDSDFCTLTEIVSGRYDREVPTILVSNLTMIELTRLVGERVIDRLKERGRALVFDWPSLRPRMRKEHETTISR